MTYFKNLLQNLTKKSEVIFAPGLQENETYEANICLRKAKSKYYQNLPDENIWLPDKFWKVIKSIYMAKIKQSLPTKSFKVNSKLTSDPTLITNGFTNFYTEIVPKLMKLLLPLNNFIWRKVKECENLSL